MLRVAFDGFEPIRKRPIHAPARRQPHSTGVRRASKSIPETELGVLLKKLFPKHRWLNGERPVWNKSPHSEYPLELDWWCPELELAIEYNGEQHYMLVPKYHPYREESLRLLKERDVQKVENCIAHGTVLISVPYWRKNDMERFLLSQPPIRDRLLFLARLDAKHTN